MTALGQPPDWLLNLFPAARSFLENGGWLGILLFLGLLGLLLIWGVFSRLRSWLSGKPVPEGGPNLKEDLAKIEPPAPSTGDRRLLVEGVPVRLRLVVLAPAGRESEIPKDRIPQLLNRIVLGLGDLAMHDKPKIAIWPLQLSYEGFANSFHKNTLAPEGENDPSRWVLLAGRAKIDGLQVMLGLGLLAFAPTTIGRRRLEAHEWPTVLRVRVRDEVK